ncbi:tripartite tricarboxylate transporter permease [archaeon]|nr:tripartite tricarboxylate transporter permease [archaeon]
MLEVFFFIFLGILLGIFSGLMPGIHLNTVSFFVAALAFQGDFNLVVLIAAMAVMHSFADFIPSILLGASDSSESCISVLPGHKMFLQGKAMHAIKLSCFGCLLGAVFSILLSPLFAGFAFQIFEFLPLLIPVILIIVLALMVFSEKSLWKKISALIAIVLSGVLGLTALNSGTIQNSLLALVSGFFAASSLLWSLKQKTVFVMQEDADVSFENKSSLSAGFLGSIAGSIVALLPSIGPSEAAFMLRKLVGEISTHAYLVLLGSISTANMVFSFFVLYYFGKTRTGAAAAVKQISSISEFQFFLLIAVVLFVAGIAFLLSIQLARKSVFFLQKINYSLLNSTVFVFLVLMVFSFTGFQGLLGFFTALSIGIFALSTGIKRSHSMAFLMLPTLAFYLTALINSF